MKASQYYPTSFYHLDHNLNFGGCHASSLRKERKKYRECRGRTAEGGPRHQVEHRGLVMRSQEKFPGGRLSRPALPICA